MEIDLFKSPKVIIPTRKRKFKVDPLNKDINIGVPTLFISKKNKNSFSLLERARRTLKEAKEIEEEEIKKEKIYKLISSLDFIINNQEEEKEREIEKEKEIEKKEEEKDINPLEKEILDLKERLSKVSTKIDSLDFNSLKSTIINNKEDINNNNNKNTSTWAEVLKKNNKNKEGINIINTNTPKKVESINNKTSYKK